MIQHRFPCSGFLWHVCQPLPRTARLPRVTSSWVYSNDASAEKEETTEQGSEEEAESNI